MKIDFIKRGAETRLILIFAGWSTDAGYYRNCVAEGWDTAVVSDYRDMTLPEIPEQYTTIYLFAYSLGVWAAANSGIDAAVKVAVFGTQYPVSDEMGIPENIFMGTAEGLTEKTLTKFHLRMAGDRKNYEAISEMLPSQPDIAELKEELLAIAEEAKHSSNERFGWHRAYIANDDRIIPSQNQQNYWKNQTGTEVVTLESPHAADMASIVEECIPAADNIGEGFANALATYKKYAKVQSEVCCRIGEIIEKEFPGNSDVGSLLEIGPGKGLLTEEWSKHLSPEKATYVDLYEMQLFGKAGDERYLVKDAERWLESTDEKFDVILSASAIQWFADPIRFLSVVKRHLNPEGIAIISTFIKGNLRQLDAFRPSPIVYHSIDEYAVFEDAKLEFWERTLEFESPREMLMHLKRTGVKPSSNGKRSTKRGINPLTSQLSSLPSHLTYTPLIITLNPLTPERNHENWR